MNFYQNQIYEANYTQRSLTFVPVFCTLLPPSSLGNHFFEVLWFIPYTAYQYLYNKYCFAITKIFLLSSFDDYLCISIPVK